MVHQLRTQLKDKEAELARRETGVARKEKAVEELVRAAVNAEKGKLAALLAEADGLVQRLREDVEARESELRRLEAEYEPKLLMLSAKETSVAETYRLQMGVLEAKEAEMAAMMVLVRDAAAEFRLPGVAAQATDALAALEARKRKEKEKEKDAGSDAPAAGEAAAAAPAAASPGKTTADALAWLNSRFAQQQQAVAEARAKGLSSPLPLSVVMQAQAQAAQYASSLSSGGRGLGGTGRLGAPSPSPYVGGRRTSVGLLPSSFGSPTSTSLLLSPSARTAGVGIAVASPPPRRAAPSAPVGVGGGGDVPTGE
jgi:hypothetical protein